MRKIYALLCAILIMATAKGQDSYGQDFWIAVPGNNSSPVPELYVTAQTTTTVTVAIPGLAFSTSVVVTAGTLQTIALPSSAQIQTSGTSNLGVHVTSTADVTVYLMNGQPQTTDAYMALPLDAIGMDYYVMGYDPDGTFNIPAQLTIVATEANTTVTINPTAPNSAALPVGVNTNVVLNQGQTYQIRSTVFTTAGDFTGSKVTSDKPISVFGGNQCTNISGALRACDHLVEQMPPTTAWGNAFVTVPLATRTAGDVFRIMAQQNSTSVMINGASVATLAAGDFYETILGSTTYNRITSNNPILVGQFSRSSQADGVTSDPFFALVPPDDQFLTSYIISSGTSTIPNNYLNITSPTSNTGNVQVDGSAVAAGLWTPIPGTTFSGAKVAVGTGVHSVTSVLPVGVLAYGFGSFDSYGYLGGQSFSPVATVSSMSLNLSATTAFQAQQVCFTATVLDQNNDPVVGVLVNYSVAGVTNTSGFGITNALGQVVLCYTTCLPGNDVFTATIAGLSDFVPVTVLATTFSVSPNAVNVNAGQQACATATVLDGSSNPVQNAVISYSVSGANNVASQNVQTNASGQALLCYTATNAGNDIITVTYGCALGAPELVNVAVSGGGVPCTPIAINFSVSGLKPFWAPASDPYTFYYGLVDAKRINAYVSGGVGPYTYTWSNSGAPALLPRAYYPANSIDLFRPLAATAVSVDVFDAGTGCTHTASVNIAWDGQYYCSTTQALWSVVICNNGVTQCVPWGTAKNLLKFNTPGVTLGACTPKTDLSSQVTGISVYPNPSSGLFTIEMPIAANSKGSIEVMDVNGQTLQAEMLDMQEGVLYHTIDLSTLPNGIYMVRVATENEFATERIQIIR